MVIRRRALALGITAALLLSSALMAQQPPQENRKLSDAQKREVQAIQKLLDGQANQATLPNDLGVTWVRDDMLKAQGNKQYVPFTITWDASKATASKLTVYWRVAAKNAAPTPPADGQKRDEKAPAAPQFAYEDMNEATRPANQPGPARLSRSFTVVPGSYDVTFVMKEPTENRRNAPAPKISVIKHTVEVPDFWDGQFNTSSVIIAQRIDPLPAPLTAAQQSERPYAMGTMEIVPAFETAFTKKAELSTFLLIYNAKTDAGNKPDVSVEYNFYAKQGGAEKFFNKTQPQELNAQTLPPQFDFAAGHQLQSGQAVPLASFPEGEYRLEIKITDKLANKSLTRDVPFTVSGS